MSKKDKTQFINDSSKSLTGCYGFIHLPDVEGSHQDSLFDKPGVKTGSAHTWMTATIYFNQIGWFCRSSTFKTKVKPHCRRKFDQIRRKPAAPEWPSDGRRTKEMHCILTYIWMSHVDTYTWSRRYEAATGQRSFTLPKKPPKKAEILAAALNDEGAHADSARHLEVKVLQMLC